MSIDNSTSWSNKNLLKLLENDHNPAEESKQNDLQRNIEDDLIITNPNLIEILNNNPKTAITAIRTLSRSNKWEAVFTLISNLEIPKANKELLDTVIKTGLNADNSVNHDWLMDYNIIDQRLEMIQTVVLPYLEDNFPQKTLFRALKDYEATALHHKQPLINPDAICKVITNAKNGIETRTEKLYKAEKDNSRTKDHLRLTLPNQIFNTLLRLAWLSQNYVFDLTDRYKPRDLIELLQTMENVIPVYLVPTHLGYPMGGGESFMHQTCRVLSEFGIKCIWISFLDPKLGWYSNDSTMYTPYYTDVRYSGGQCKEKIQQAIIEFHPDLIHAHGGTSDDTMEIAEKCRITTMIGYHFWGGLIELGQTGNQHILKHIDLHKLRPAPHPQSKLIWKYVASEFMHEVYTRLGGQEDLHILHPISDSAQFFANRHDIGDYVLQVNVCSLKGGKIFLESVKALGNEIPFMGIQSEHDSSDLFRKLAEEVEQHPLCKLHTYGNVREFYRTARIVIVPTLVDETFCRVAFEAAMNGIPVICTANGYLPYMLGDTGIYLSEEPTDWIHTINELYHDTERLKHIGESQRARLMTMFGSDFKHFISSSMQLIDESTTKNIGIFTTWGDIGLGNLSHSYTKVLRSIGYRVHIFSFQPYSSEGKSLVKQSNPNDWATPANADSVYYSFNNRESVTAYELRQFILTNNIKTLLVPEICWQVNWDRLIELNIDGLAICGIPMIEIVIKEEAKNHNSLTATLNCTKLSESTLKSAGVTNGAFLGHGYGRPLTVERVERKHENLRERKKIRFLHIAGHNPVTRKNTPKVIEAFEKALLERDDIELTVTSMASLRCFYTKELPPGITVLNESLSRDAILDLYESHDVSIQVSSHEGLGLGFYESISRCTPVISLNAPPHNEVIIEGKTGWLIDANPIPMPDNDRSLLPAWTFDTSALADCISSLDRTSIDELMKSTLQTYRTQFDEIALLTRFLKTLPRTNLPNKELRKLIATDPPLATKEYAEALNNDAPLDHSGITSSSDSSIRALTKRILLSLARRLYQLSKPITRRVAYRLRLLMIEATSDIREEMKSLGNAQALYMQELVRASKYQGAEIESHRGLLNSFEDFRTTQFQELLWTVTSVKKQTNNNSDVLSELARTMNSLRAIRREVRFTKEHMASYAGGDTVLTYLQDESPIFVNTGDLGCPSPIINGGVWEQDNTNVLLSLITSDTVFIDIGANVGYYSIVIGNRLGNNGKIFAIEPHPKLTNLIERSIHLNGLESVITVVQCAVSDREERVNLFYPHSHLGKGSTTRNISEAGVAISVEGRTLDEILPKDLVVDLVKIDVEGHELAVLRGMRDIFARSPKIKVLFEKLEHSDFGTDPILDLLNEFSLELYGVGPFAVLQPLDARSYSNWVGDILAAPKGEISHLRRTGFCVYPGQLTGKGVNADGVTRYAKDEPGVLFFGPDWHLPYGRWRVQLHGAVIGSIRVEIVEDDEIPIAEMFFSESTLEGYFIAPHNITQFQMRAYVSSKTAVNLERFEFQRD